MIQALLPPIVASKFLAGLDEQALGLILGASQLRKASANETIIITGEKATQLFLTSRGQIRYYIPTKSGDEVLLGLLVPGDVFGLSTLLKHSLFRERRSTLGMRAARVGRQVHS